MDKQKRTEQEQLEFEYWQQLEFQEMCVESLLRGSPATPSLPLRGTTGREFPKPVFGEFVSICEQKKEVQ